MHKNYSVEQTSGVVVDVGHGVATCCAVWQGRECPTPLSCDPTECHAHKVAEMVHSTVASCSEDAQPTLRHTVVLTGMRTRVYSDHAEPCTSSGWNLVHLVAGTLYI